jgi:hypothetical protein
LEKMMIIPDIITTPEVFHVHFPTATDERARAYYEACLRWSMGEDARVGMLANKCMKFKGHHEWHNSPTGSVTNPTTGLTMYGQLCNCGTFRVVSEAHLKEQTLEKKVHADLWGDGR